MIDYLKNYNLTDNDLLNIKKRYNASYLNYFEVMMDNVCTVLNYFKSIGVKDLTNILLYRPDLCFRNLDYLKEQLNKYDSKMVLYIFNNDINDLVNFDI